jgi:hypothetical protein
MLRLSLVRMHAGRGTGLRRGARLCSRADRRISRGCRSGGSGRRSGRGRRGAGGRRVSGLHLGAHPDPLVTDHAGFFSIERVKVLAGEIRDEEGRSQALVHLRRSSWQRCQSRPCLSPCR